MLRPTYPTCPGLACGFVSDRLAFDSNDRDAPVIEAMLAAADRPGVALRVHADDDMMTFLLSSESIRSRALMMYFRGGLSIVDLVESVARRRFGSLDEVGSVLDFAAGYGRSTRFLVARMRADRIWVSDIQDDAMAFSAAEFGVNTLPSATDPRHLGTDRQFDLVTATSLFTHLPRHTFALWLRTLWGLVRPGGALMFTVRDEAVNTSGLALVDGFAYLPVSEIGTLPSDEYGTSYTNESFVRSTLTKVIGHDAHGAVRLPRAINVTQDAWVVAKGADLSGFGYEGGPMGALDEAFVESGKLVLRGWAGDLGNAAVHARTHSIDSVLIRVDEAIEATVRPSEPRPGLARAFGREGDPSLASGGWSAQLERTDWTGEEVLVMTASCAHGGTNVIDATRLSEVLRRTSQREKQPEVAASQGHPPAQSASRMLPLANTQAPVDSRISPLERMPFDDVAGYLAVGESALKAIRIALMAARRPDPLNVLDMGCGHGRVLRWLAAAWPAARFTACDVLADGVDFCADTFGATPVYSADSPDLSLFPERYDLIWVGSLLTHLNSHKWDEFLALFSGLLAPDGLLVATTCGELVKARMRRGDLYGYPTAAVERALRMHDETGFGFVEMNPDAVDRGLAFASPDWTIRRVQSQTTLRVALYTEALWANHQDVVAAINRPLNLQGPNVPST